MKQGLSKGWMAVLIVAVILIADQVIKILVKTNMYYGEDIRIADWLYLRFVENPGMAFGMRVLPTELLVIFRILFVCVIGWWITLLVRSDYKRGYVAAIALIMAGAIGNILDNVFYGVIFSDSTYTEVATLVPLGEGYAGWLTGHVVDMFYFPLFSFDWPMWMPFVGGEHFIFFSPVFNLADAAVSCGVILIFLFYAKLFGDSVHLLGIELKKRFTSSAS